MKGKGKKLAKLRSIIRSFQFVDSFFSYALIISDAINDMIDFFYLETFYYASNQTNQQFYRIIR